MSNALCAHLHCCAIKKLSNTTSDCLALVNWLADIFLMSPSDLYEADHGALELARLNLARPDHANPGVQLGFHWHDVSSGLPGRYNFIVTNPPFHQGREDLPELGRAFIAAAAQALLPGGRLWLVANRHLPYEAALASGFKKVRVVEMRDGFKVIEAVKANP